jgi:hypothetical protein
MATAEDPHRTPGVSAAGAWAAWQQRTLPDVEDVCPAAAMCEDAGLSHLR